MDIPQTFANKNIFILGATGFLAKILLEKILRVQPLVNKVFLLIRETPEKSIEQRLHTEVFESELFHVMKAKFGTNFNSMLKEKIVPIPGDASLENLGIHDSMLLQRIQKEVDIIVNSAAATKFDERYDVALGVNALGVENIVNFANNCPKLKVILHVSTAYVHGSRAAGLLLETPFHVGETLAGAETSYLDINNEKNIVEEKLWQLQQKYATENEITLAMKDLGIKRTRLHGWPNTYVFTKAIGEMIFTKFKGKAAVIIVRPTIITSTYKEPFPGWIEGLRTIDSVFVAYGKGKTSFFLGDPHSPLDLIPGDMVVNAMLVALATHFTNQPSDDKLKIYQVGSSRRNPIKLQDIADNMYCFLKKNPLVDATGKYVMVGQAYLVDSISKFRKYIIMHYLPFLMMLVLVNVITFNHYGKSYLKAKRSFGHVMQLAELYEPYVFPTGIFDDSNVESLRRSSMRGSNSKVDIFGFDPLCIQWKEYLLNIHFPGIVKYVLK